MEKRYRVCFETVVMAESAEEAIEKAAEENMPCDILDFEGMLHAYQENNGEEHIER
jgi:hypothetical protein